MFNALRRGTVCLPDSTRGKDDPKWGGDDAIYSGPSVAGSSIKWRRQTGSRAEMKPSTVRWCSTEKALRASAWLFMFRQILILNILTLIL